MRSGTGLERVVGERLVDRRDPGQRAGVVVDTSSVPCATAFGTRCRRSDRPWSRCSRARGRRTSATHCSRSSRAVGPKPVAAFDAARPQPRRVVAAREARSGVARQHERRPSRTVRWRLVRDPAPGARSQLRTPSPDRGLILDARDRELNRRRSHRRDRGTRRARRRPADRAATLVWPSPAAGCPARIDEPHRTAAGSRAANCTDEAQLRRRWPGGTGPLNLPVAASIVGIAVPCRDDRHARPHMCGTVASRSSLAARRRASPALVFRGDSRLEGPKPASSRRTR